MTQETGILSKSAQKGLSKFLKLTACEMIDIGNKYNKETGLNPNNIENTEEFYEFVDKEVK